MLITTIIQVPQLIENYKSGSADGISLAFLTVWFIGDLANFFGAVWARLYVLLGLYVPSPDQPMSSKTRLGSKDTSLSPVHSPNLLCNHNIGPQVVMLTRKSAQGPYSNCISDILCHRRCSPDHSMSLLQLHELSQDSF